MTEHGLGLADPVGPVPESCRSPGVSNARTRAPGDDRIGRGRFRLLLWVVAAAPIPLGAVFPLASAFLATLVGLLLLWTGLATMGSSGVGRAAEDPVIGPCALPFLAAALWAGIQASPWTPVGWHHPLWALAGAALGRELPGAISVDPYETLSAVMRLLSYGGVFWLAFRLCRAPGRAETAFLCITAIGALQAIYALADVFSGANLVLWYPKTDYAGTATGTFFNRNTYATYAGLGLICASALIARGLFDQLSQPAADARVRPRFRWWLFPAWMLLATALLLSQSRGGVLATLAGLLAFSVTVAVAKEMPRRARSAAVALILVLAVGFLAISGGGVATRLLWADVALQGRAEIWAQAADEIARRPLTGDGYGTFAEVYAGISKPKAGDDGYVDKAHNTYVEEALELGIPAEVLLTFAIVLAALASFRGLDRWSRASSDARNDPAFRVAAGAAGIGASTLVALHSVVDFSLQIPALAATYAFILGAALAGALPRRLSDPRSSPWPTRVEGFAPLALGASILLLAVPRVAAATLLLPGDRVLRAIENGANPGLRDLAIFESSRSRALAWSGSGHIRTELGLAKLLRNRSQSGAKADALRASARHDLETGLARAPANPYGWTRLGLTEIEADAPASQVLPALRMAVRTGPFQPDLLLPQLKLWLAEAPYLTADDKAVFGVQTRLAWSRAPAQLVETVRATGQIELVRAALPAADRESFDRLLAAPVPQAPVAAIQ
jgi:O-antigen ligase